MITPFLFLTSRISCCMCARPPQLPLETRPRSGRLARARAGMTPSWRARCQSSEVLLARFFEFSQGKNGQKERNAVFSGLQMKRKEGWEKAFFKNTAHAKASLFKRCSRFHFLLLLVEAGEWGNWSSPKPVYSYSVTSLKYFYEQTSPL